MHCRSGGGGRNIICRRNPYVERARGIIAARCNSPDAAMSFIQSAALCSRTTHAQPAIAFA